MATYETSLSGASGLVVGPGWARQKVSAIAIVAMTTAMLDNANDDVGLFYVPAGAVITAIRASASDMDSGTPALAIDIGDSGDEDRLMAASTIGQAGTFSSALAPTGHLYKYTAKTQIRAYIQTAAATAVAGTLKVALEYFVEENFSTTALVAA